MNKIKIAVLFGGKSPEHEISIITGVQILNAINKEKYEVYPVYVTKSGTWILGDKTFYDPKTFVDLNKAIEGKKELILSLDSSNKGFLIKEKKSYLFEKNTRLDIEMVFPAFHGKFGEDGCAQGLLEIANIPYVGCDVTSSAIGMDKVLSKRVAASIGIPVMESLWIDHTTWEKEKQRILTKIKQELNFPVFVKPARLGSSIGINKAHNPTELEDYINVAFFYDNKVLVEKSLEGAKEVNISIMGNNPYDVSVCEMPVSTGEILSFADKYTSKEGRSKGMASAKRIIPAPIKDETRKLIEKYVQSFFAEIGGQGIARCDFLVSSDESKVFFNEVNTLPGSISFYLWQINGISFEKLIDLLIDLSFKRNETRLTLVSSFKSNVLQGFKGVKGIKN